jgi:YndJ-like protein
VTTESRERWDRGSATAGIIVWAALAGLSGAGKAPLGVIELLFLLAPLVIVPLGTSLAGAIAPVKNSPLSDAARILQPFAGLLAVGSFWMSPGPRAAVFASPWIIVCALWALAGAITIFAGDVRTIPALAANVGRIDLAIAAAWLAVSRLGFGPLGFQEPIPLLTAVHFHFTGFGTAILAAAAAAFARRSGKAMRPTNLIVTAAVLLPFVIAAGFVFSPTLKMVAVAMLSTSVISLAIWQFALASRMRNWTARIFLALSSLAVVAGISLAAIYAIGDWLGKPWLTIPRMASTHGWLNGVGFVLLGLLGWLVEFGGREAAHAGVGVTAAAGAAMRCA